MTNHNKAKELIKAARSALGGVLYIDIHPAKVLYDLTAFQKANEYGYKATGYLIANTITRRELVDLGWQCFWWAEEWHGWPEQSLHIMDELRSTYISIDTFIKSTIIDVFVFEYNIDEEIKEESICNCEEHRYSFVWKCPVHGERELGR